ncbi:MAG TPA: glycosyltransferase, partial [Gemmataceae bacterium]|nr:glycosyltransferase [Gemmataceae bacterium]
ALACDSSHVVAGLNLAETLVALGQSAEAVEQARRALAMLDEAKRIDEDVWDSGHFPPAFDHFRVEWERAAWQHAGDPASEEQAKRALLRWRLHANLGDLTGEIHHYYEAALARPDLPLSQAALGNALARIGKPEQAIPHLQQALDGNPFDRDTARALFEALGATGDGLGQRRLARERRLLHRAASHVLPAEPAYERVPPVGDELASIIILCHNQLDYTRLCLDSIFRYTRPAYELVLVDNASTDGTPAYLDEIAGLAGTPGGPQRVVVLRNETNRGFAAGCNQALAVARGRYLVFLNNDTVVTEGWLDGLVSWALHDWPHVGLVGPMSNHAPAPQQAAADYLDLDGLPAFARWHRQDHSGKGMHVPRLTGFCLLVRREVLEQVGGLDESFGVGFFEDDDLCIRAAKAGFGLVLAQDVFIHHFGNRTFAGMRLDVERLLRDNFELFKAKWGPEHASHYQVPSANGTAPKSGVSGRRSLVPGRDSEADMPACVAVSDTPLTTHHSPLTTSRQRVGLTMIVRNEEQNLPACLDSVMDLVDEAVIADTGSTYRTKEIAARYGTKVIDFPWVDSFAAARNASLAHLTAEWGLFMDADDRLDAENRDRLRKLIAGLRPGMAAFVFKCLCPPDPETGNATVVDHVRLFPNHPGVRWEFRVHEQVLPSLRRLGAIIRWSDVVIHHTGYLDPALQAGKRERNLRLLRLEEKDNPDHPFTLFNLGCLHQDMKR